MNVLHVLSNYKWTERAEPAADLAVGQKKAGATVFFACGRNRRLDQEDSVAFRLRKKGLEPDELRLNKHFQVLSAVRDVSALRRIIDERQIDVLHAHMPNAHLIGTLSARLSARRPHVVRTLYNPDKDEQPLRMKIACRIGTDGIVAIAPEAQAWLETELNWPSVRTRIIEPSVDVERFGTRPEQDLREEFAIARDAFVLGMVTAIGPRRRLDIAIRALKRLADRHPNVRLFIVGRGKIDLVIEGLARELGVRDRIVLAGYCRGERLVQAYRTMTMLVYPMPGTDKSCRTVREAMATGLPVAASRVGFLPRLIEDGKTGRLMDVDPDSLAEIVEDAIAHPDRLAAMAEESLKAAQRRFSPALQAEKTLAFYRDMQVIALG